MVFALAGSPDVGYAVPATAETVAGGLGQVVVFLFGHLDETVAKRFWRGVAVANDDFCLRAVDDGAVAGHHVAGIAQDAQRHFVFRESAIGYDDGTKCGSKFSHRECGVAFFTLHFSLFIICFHLK